MKLKKEDGKKHSVLSAYEYLSLIEQAIERQTRKTQTSAHPVKGWVGLMFLSGNSVLMCPLHEITAILPITNFVRIPKVKSWMIGVCHYQGEALPITDLSAMLISKLSVISKYSRIFVIKRQDEYVGILVSRVLGLQRVTQTYGIEHLPKELMAEYFPFVSGAMVTERFQLPIISCKEIIKHHAFNHVMIDETESNDDTRAK